MWRHAVRRCPRIAGNSRPMLAAATATAGTHARVTLSALASALPSPFTAAAAPISTRALLRFADSATPSPASGDALDVAGSLERVSSQFANARMDIEDAVESVGSTYYPGDIETAQESVAECLASYEEVQTALKQAGREAEAQKLRESWSLRMEQLKAELEAAVQAGGGDH